MRKICFISSSGGHFEQLMMLKPLMDKYDSFVMTEKTQYQSINCNQKVYALKQVNRKEFLFLFNMLWNIIKSIKIMVIEKPDFVISTGALVCIPMCLLAKIFNKKVIFIESFAKVSSPTLTGRLVYKFADQFYIQWEELRSYYPNAVYKGGIY